MARKMADCRRFESEANCTLTIIGEEEEVMLTAVHHAEAVHGHHMTPEMIEELRSLLEDETAFVPGERAAQPFPA